MSALIKFDIKELKKLVFDKNSCVVERKVVQNLALQPWCLGNLKEALKNVLDYKIGKFDKEFNGIILAYKNVRILQNIGAIKTDSADIIFQVQADYFIFIPYIGATLKGIVNKKTVTHLGVLVHRVFNVVIPRPTDNPGTKWLGSSVQEGQTIVFRIVVMDLFGALPYIRGELDERFLHLGPEDSNPEETLAPVPMNVSYVDFDKTKPGAPRHNGDWVSHVNQPQVTPNVSTTKCGDIKPKSSLMNNCKDASVDDRSKSKRQYKLPDDNAKQSELKPRQSKKNRKD